MVLGISLSEFPKISQIRQRSYRQSLYFRIGLFFVLFAFALILLIYYLTEQTSYSQDTFMDAQEAFFFSQLVQSWGNPPDTLKVRSSLSNLKLYGSLSKDGEKIWSSPSWFPPDEYASYSDSEDYFDLHGIKIPLYISFGEIITDNKVYTSTYASDGNYEFLLGLEEEIPSEVATNFIPGSIVTVIFVSLLFIGIRNYLKPIQFMKNRIALLEKGDLDSQIPIFSEDELADLSTDINQMIFDIKDLLNRKQQLLSEVSHELLSPLARIRLLIEMLPDHKNKERLEEETKFLKGMVTNLLMSDRLSGPYSKLELNEINLHEVIDKAIAMITDNEAFIQVKGDIPEIKLTIDDTKITLALKNLLDNALKYGKSDKPIEISAKLKNDWVEISVRDFGRGISQENINKITEPFYRIKEIGSKKSGFGMGLSLTKKIMETHKGKLNIESEIKKYSVFTLQLPLN